MGSSCRFESLEERRFLSVSTGIAANLNVGVAGRTITDLSNPGISQDGLSDAIPTADNQIVLVGSADYDIGIARYRSNGALDQSFGTQGIVRYHYLDPQATHVTYSNGTSAFSLPDGKVLIAGWSDRIENNGSIYTLLLLRLKVDGSLDETFGNNGVTTVPSAKAGSMHRAPDGNIIIDGTVGSSTSRALWEFDENGGIVSSFGTGGRLLYSASGPSQVINIAKTLPGGKSLAFTTLGIARLLPGGAVDSTYGTNGYAVIPPSTVGFQSDGSIVYAWDKYPSFGNDSDIAVRRLDPNGKPDSTFGSGGTTTINLGTFEGAATVIIQDDGRIIIGSQATAFTDHKQIAGISRLLADGTFDAGFADGGTAQFGDDLLRTLILLPGGNLMALGTTSTLAPEDAASQNEFGNFDVHGFVLDPPITIESGGPYGPVDEGHDFTVSAAGSTYAGGSIVKYEWDYGYEGHQFNVDATGATATLHAGNNPSGVVGLQVTTSDGLQAVTTTSVSISNLPPIAHAGNPKLAAVGVPVLLTVASDDYVPEDQTATLDWGDGSPSVTLQRYSQQSPSFPFTHTYRTRGVYIVKLTITDADGASGTDQTTIRVGDILATAFIDGSGDGSIDADEVPLPGEHVYLDLNQNTQFDPGEPSEVTNDRGEVLFDGLTPGTYALRADPVAGYQFSLPVNGVTTATVSAGIGSATFFGLTTRAFVSGIVYDDANGNGLRDPGEAPLPGSVVRLYGPLSYSTVTTDALGVYRFNGVLPGTYYAISMPLNGWVQTFPTAGMSTPLTLAALDAVGNIDFGQIHAAPATISGTVFNDADGDGIRETSETGASGRIVYIDGNNNGVLDLTELSAMVSTEAYSLPGLPAGHYFVRLAPRNGWITTTPSPDESYEVSVTAGTSATGYNFGTHQTDLTPPQVTGATSRVDEAGITITVQFNEAIADPPKTSSITDVSHAHLYQAATTYDPVAHAATIHLSNPFPSGNYRFRIGGVHDDAGNILASSFVMDFFVLHGDVNDDRSVDFADLVTVAQNYGATGKTKSQGDLSGDGVVGFADLVVVAQNYGTTIAPLPSAADAVAVSPTVSPDSTSKMSKPMPESTLARSKAPVPPARVVKPDAPTKPVSPGLLDTPFSRKRV